MCSTKATDFFKSLPFARKDLLSTYEGGFEKIL